MMLTLAYTKSSSSSRLFDISNLQFIHSFFIHLFESGNWAHRNINKQVARSAMAERPRELDDFKKARIDGGTDNHSLKGFSQVSPLPLQSDQM